MATRVHWLIELTGGIVGAPHRFWSGEGAITIGGEEYMGVTRKDGGAVMSISELQQEVGAPDKRLTINLVVVAEAFRRLLTMNIGAATVRIGWIYSRDMGQTWVELPRSFTGRLSAPTIKDGILTAEVETFSGDVDRGRPLMWSDVHQQERYPGDRGFEFTRELAKGVDLRWPQ